MALTDEQVAGLTAERFNNTRISRGLFRKSAELMGFGKIVEIGYRETWLPAQWYAPHKAWLCMRS